MNRIWYGIGFLIIPVTVLLLGYLNIHPELYRSVPQEFGNSYDTSDTSISWDEEEAKDPPIKYTSDSYKTIEVWTEIVDVTSFWSLWNRPNSKLEFGWKYVVKNLSEDRRDISVTYDLIDKDDRVLVSSHENKTAEPGEEITIIGDAEIDWFRVDKIHGRTWKIGNSVTK